MNVFHNHQRLYLRKYSDFVVEIRLQNYKNTKNNNEQDINGTL